MTYLALVVVAVVLVAAPAVVLVVALAVVVHPAFVPLAFVLAADFVVNGDVEIDECIDWCEIYIEDIDEYKDDFWQQDYVVASGITKDNVKEYAVDGYVRVGGYDSWDFQI